MHVYSQGIPILPSAQKNVGPAGLVVVIIRKDLLTLKRKLIAPLMLDYKVFADSGSCYNTPPTFNIYVTGLIFKHLLSVGLSNVAAQNAEKARRIYAMITKYPSVYSCPVSPAYQSRMNIPFRIMKDGVTCPDAEKLFLKESVKRDMEGLAGHRSVGGVRASIYNAMDLAGVDVLVAFMEEFAQGQLGSSCC
jgi:phosphoserine aminotransferase